MAIALLIFFAVSLGIIASFQLMDGLLSSDQKQARDRLSKEFEKKRSFAGRLFKGLDRGPQGVQPLLTEIEMARMAARSLSDRNRLDQIRDIVEQTGLSVNIGQLAVIVCVNQALLAIAGYLVGGASVAAIGLVAGTLPVPLFVYNRYTRRREKMLTQLPDAFELMSRVIRAGQSTPQALLAVAETAGQPAADEFARCFHQLNMGLSPEQAFQEMARRSPLVELRIFLMALSIQRQTGGKLSDVLDRLAEVIRSRIRLARQVKTLTAEGRLQGNVLLVMPFVLFAILMVINRSYAIVLLDHLNLLAAAGVSMLIGVLWIRKIIQIDF